MKWAWVVRKSAGSGGLISGSLAMNFKSIYVETPLLGCCDDVLDRLVTLALGLSLLSCAIKVVRPNAWGARGSDELDG
ncbi:hypothetical protein SLEP1_g15119 [Rubroshorea leprosula]|uniref:Uncharacterized protein n=1 Tax=Rubroshorea leprosula TaxID=152421 RepID=A0AAV5ILC4_9ROSI|nr:hypothetical protein SLEP1_g15119 [Rubroshorea leprosula]